jgi:proline dehydrogenase
MDAINELSCEFAMTVFARMETNAQMTPQDAANLIRNFHNALHRLQEQSNHASLKKILPQEISAKEKTMSGNH